MQHDHAASGYQHRHARSVAALDPAADKLVQPAYPDRIHSDVLGFSLPQLRTFHFHIPSLEQAGRDALRQETTAHGCVAQSARNRRQQFDGRPARRRRMLVTEFVQRGHP